MSAWVGNVPSRSARKADLASGGNDQHLARAHKPIRPFELGEGSADLGPGVITVGRGQTGEHLV